MTNMKKYFSLVCLLLGMMVTGVISSCNKKFSRMLPDREYQDTAKVAFGDRKVLYLIVDGARGLSVNATQTPNIEGILPNSIYSWVSLNDQGSVSKANNWADLLTGVKKEKHKVLDMSFTNTNLQSYPVMFKRIKQSNPNIRIAAFTSSPELGNNLTDGADLTKVVATDEETKAAIVDNLMKDTAGLVVGHFTDIDKAGGQSGYDTSFAEYTAAIGKFDGYVGEILAALKKRPAFEKEDWLVVIASSGGGTFPIPPDQNDNTVFSNPVSNTFVIYYNPAYKQRIVVKPFTGNRYIGKTIRLKGETVTAQIDTADDFNIDDTTNFTIELKIKKNEEAFFWPSVLGKRNEWSGGHPSVGWVIYLQDHYWFFEWRGTTDGDYHQCQGADLKKGKWEHMAVKCETRGGRRYVRTYTNGAFNNEVDITPSGSFRNNNALKLGYLNGQGHGSPDVYVTDIRFFKFTVPDATIDRYSCETSIDQSHPYFNFLAGYWPATDGQGTLIRDYGPLSRDFRMLDTYPWESFNDLICPPSDVSLGELVPQTTDIPTQIITWFKIASKQSWDLDGRVWLDQ
jgi:hypothetical protein